MSMATIGIVAHVDRYDLAAKLRADVDASYVAYDSGALGCRANHVRVWKQLADANSAWVLVLEDDAIPVNDFGTQLDSLLSVAPSPIVSLYLGTGNPGHWQKPIERALARADRAHAHWVTCECLIHGVATAIETRLVRSMLRGIRPYPNAPIDEAISRWAIAQDLLVSYTVPSPVDHADMPTLIERHPDGQRRNKARSAWRVGQRDEWASGTTELVI